MKNDLKIFLLKLALVVGVLVVVDFAAGLFLSYLFDQQKTGIHYKIKHAVKDSKEEIMIFGNSHAAEHFDAPLMQKLTSKAVFNFGNGGQSIFYTYPVVKSTLYHHSPKLIIVNMDYDELAYYPKAYELISIFLPHYNTSPVIDSAISLMPYNETLKCTSNLYRYNSTLGNTMLNTFITKYTRTKNNLGYEPKNGSFCENGSANTPTQHVEKFRFDKNKINYLLRLIDAAQSRNVKLMVTTSPMYHYDAKAHDVYKRRLQQILAKYKVPYLDYGTNEGFYGKCEYFNDNSHLNSAGAERWTKECVRFIENEIF